MLQVPFIRENKALIIERLAIKNVNATAMINAVITLDEERRALQTKLDNTLAESNSISKEIGELFKSGQAEKANVLKAKTTNLKEVSKQLSDDLNTKSNDLKTLLFQIPNIPHESVPPGKSEDDNVEIFIEGDIPKLYNGALPHWELAKKYDIIDFELGNKKDKSTKIVKLSDYLSKKQQRIASTKPDIIWQFAQRLKKVYAAKGEEISVYVDCKISVNGRTYQRFILPHKDITALDWNTFKHSDWLLPSQLE